jgi:hypothetical protein
MRTLQATIFKQVDMDWRATMAAALERCRHVDCCPTGRGPSGWSWVIDPMKTCLLSLVI